MQVGCKNEKCPWKEADNSSEYPGEVYECPKCQGDKVKYCS